MSDPDDCWPGDEDGKMTAEEYDTLLRGGVERVSSPVPGEFVRGAAHVWFVHGGGFDVGANGYHLWHNGSDPVYAAGSQIAGGHAVPIPVLREATDILKRMLERSAYAAFPFSPKAIVHLQWLIDLGEAALSATPSEDIQSVDA